MQHEIDEAYIRPTKPKQMMLHFHIKIINNEVCGFVFHHHLIYLSLHLYKSVCNRDSVGLKVKEEEK